MIDIYNSISSSVNVAAPLPDELLLLLHGDEQHKLMQRPRASAFLFSMFISEFVLLTPKLEALPQMYLLQSFFLHFLAFYILSSSN